MTRVVIDPDEVRQFARELLRSAAVMHDGKSQIESHFRELREVWHDRKYEQFERVFSETMARLAQFLHDAEVYADYLERKARKADAYHSGGY
ncbi:MAG TPA: hypothetical protein VJ866_09280 [Pyrinomonadaceae bacterium]|nr:hypothetical protein [Pyrinomonadaceae bacterium]